MCQRAVEQALGRLVTDDRFRREFHEDARRACFAAGLDLSPAEIAALAAIPIRALLRFGAALDDRICRLDVPRSPGTEEILS